MIGEKCDGPPDRYGNMNWAKELAQVMESPYQWFVYRSVSRNMPDYLKRNHLRERFPDIYITTRNYHGGKDGRSRCDMYVIYEPEEDDL